MADIPGYKEWLGSINNVRPISDKVEIIEPNINYREVVGRDPRFKTWFGLYSEKMPTLIRTGE